MYKFVKRIIDILFSLIGCIILLPFTILIKICYMLCGDFSSIFFVQERIGLNGKIFRMYKFRSMVANADQILEELMKNNKEIRDEYNLNKKLENDPRITKIGKIIRKCSLDELPQFINILKSDMSLIGNRPYLVREKKDIGSYYKDIIKTKPGLTGYWQVNLRNRGTFKERLEMESFYSNNCGFKMDVKIFFKTFIVVLNMKGAK